MAGGLLNLVSGGTDTLVFGNPQKTYWVSTYKQITNFGLQNFRVDYEGLRQLQVSSDTTYLFKIKRYAELLTDTYLSVQLPDIYSPLFVDESLKIQPYEFQWIKNLGAMMIRSVKFTIGGTLIQQLSGYDMVALANRDLSYSQKQKWNDMIGNIPELYAPGSRGAYPNATVSCGVSEPSIRGRELIIPIPIWWSMTSQQAFPLVSLQYNELHIEIVLRPIRELFQIRDITNLTGNTDSVIAPNMTIPDHQFYLFLQSPPENGAYSTNTTWNENTHLSCTYCFLSEEEAYKFATNQQRYLVKEVYDTWFYGVSLTDKIWLHNSTGLVPSWMILFQRSDVQNRNEWSNFTNWPYGYLPSGITQSKYTDSFGQPIYQSGPYAVENIKDILLTLGIYFDGAIREEERPVSMFKYEQQYLTIPGQGQLTLPGLYCYNYCLNTDPLQLQPSGAINLTKYSKIEISFTTISPPLNPDSSPLVICDPLTGQQLGVNKSTTNLYLYSFNVMVIEERYNILSFVGGNAALMFAR